MRLNEIIMKHHTFFFKKRERIHRTQILFLSNYQNNRSAFFRHGLHHILVFEAFLFI